MLVVYTHVKLELQVHPWKVTEFINEAEKDREMDTMDQLPRQNSAIQLPSVDDEESDDFTIIQSIQVFKGS